MPKEDTQFKPGQSGNPAGRPKGSRNKLSEQFLQALSDDFNEHGMEAIIAMRESSPRDYNRIIAMLLPKLHELSGPDGDDLPMAANIVIRGNPVQP